MSFNLPLVLAAAQTACSRRESNEPWVNLTSAEAELLAAVVDQIIPPDSTPGASEAGVVYFIDAALGSFFTGAEKLKEGLKDLDRLAGGNGFAKLDFDQQTALLKTVESASSQAQSAGQSSGTLVKRVESTFFFRSVLDLTRMGMFALPEYGGNREHAGWKLIGFEHRHVWQAPYGYYDEQVAGEESLNAGS